MQGLLNQFDAADNRVLSECDHLLEMRGKNNVAALQTFLEGLDENSEDLQLRHDLKEWVQLGG